MPAPSHQAELERARQLHAAGRLAEAVPVYERLIAADPRNADALHLLGVAHLQVGRHAEALSLIDRALAARPAFPEAHNNRGNLLKAMGRPADAAAAYRAAIAANPRYAAAHHHLGVALIEMGEFDGAIAACREALRLKPDFADALSNLGTALRERGELEAALASYARALALQPDRAESLAGQALVLNRLDRTAESLAAYDRALALRPDYVEGRIGRAMLHLSLGRLAEGWPDFEVRLQKPGFEAPRHSSPRWRGEDLTGRSLLCLAEQGFGDTIQFVRFAAALAGRAKRVVVEAPPSLVSLLQSVAGIEVVPAGAPLGDIDCHIPLMSLPHEMTVGLDDLPVAAGYIAAEPARLGRWRDRVPSAKLRVGLNWQGNPKAEVDRFRSMPLAMLAPLFEVADVSFVALQVGAGSEQIAAAPFASRLTHFGGEIAADGSFLDTAALVAGLDLVVTTDTAIAHLAGALGARTWVLLQKVPDWRWLRDREDCPWYPSMRLFRQAERGDWSAPVAQVAAALSALRDGGAG